MTGGEGLRASAQGLASAPIKGEENQSEIALSLRFSQWQQGKSSQWQRGITKQSQENNLSSINGEEFYTEIMRETIIRFLGRFLSN